MNNDRILIPIDFNSLSVAIDGKLNLTDYYMDYAFYSEGLKPLENMDVIFFDSSWRGDKAVGEIMCLDAVIKKIPHEFGSWSAELEGKIYILGGAPKRNYFSRFIGANTRLHEEKGKILVQKLGLNPDEEKLDGISAFVFPPGIEMPDFSKVIGMNTKELAEFFSFKDLKTEKESLINEVATLVSKPKYIAEIRKNHANGEYLGKVRTTLKTFLDKGYSKEKMIKDLGEYMLKLRAEGKDKEEDLVLEALSFLDGWSGPNSQL